MIKKILEILKKAKLSYKKFMYKLFVKKLEKSLFVDTSYKFTSYFGKQNNLHVLFYVNKNGFTSEYNLYFTKVLKPWEVNCEYKKTIKRIGG